MRLFCSTGWAVLLSLAVWATPAGAQGQPQIPTPAPPAPAPVSPSPVSRSPVSPSSFTPAPVPSRLPSSADSGTAINPPPTDAPLAPGSMRVRINGSVTGYAGVGADSSRTGH